MMIIIIQRSNFVLNELMRRYLKGAGDGDEESLSPFFLYTFFPPCFFGQKKKRRYFAVSVAVFDQFSNLNVTFTLYVFSFYFMIYLPIISNTLLGT